MDDKDGDSDIYMVMEYMSEGVAYNLNNPQKMDLEVVRNYFIQILLALEYST
jgi:serine/threonine protein kinase